MADNVAITRDAIDAWNAHDREGYVAFYKPDVALHGFPDDVVDAATVGDFFAGLWESVPDARIELGDAFASGDQVAVRLTVKGTHEAELWGVPGTHNPISFDVCTIIRFEDGLIAERWNVADFLSVMVQIGAVPAPA